MSLVAILRVALPPLVLCGLQSPALHAGIIPVSQDRSVFLRVSDFNCGPSFPCLITETEEASGFGLFDESLVVPGHGTAEQTSSISPLLVRAVGLAEAESGRVPFTTYVTAVSHFELTFDITSTEAWRLMVKMPAVSFFFSGAEFSLVGPGVNIVTGSGIDPLNIDYLVTLTPGSYNLRSRIRVDAQEEFGLASYDVTFEPLQSVPEPGTAFLLIVGALVLGVRTFFWRCRSNDGWASGVN